MMLLTLFCSVKMPQLKSWSAEQIRSQQWQLRGRYISKSDVMLVRIGIRVNIRSYQSGDNRAAH